MSIPPSFFTAPARNRSILITLEVVLVFTVLMGRYCRKIDENEFHVDESHYIETSNALEAYVGGDFASPVWNESYTTLTQPPLVRYIVGVGRRIGGYGPGDLNKTWELDESVDENIKRGAKPSDKLLWWSRLPMAILAALSLFVLYVFARLIGGFWAGIIWFILMLSDQFLLFFLREAMGEAPLLAGFVLTLALSYLALRYIVAGQRAFYWKAFGALGLIGVASGLAATVKMNGFTAMGLGVAVSAILALRLPVSHARRLLFTAGGTLLVGLAAFAVFIALNPFLWPNISGRIHRMVEHRLGSMKLQTQTFPETEFKSAGHRIVRISQHVFQEDAAMRMKAMLVPNLLLTVAGFCVVAVAAKKWVVNRASDPGAFLLLLTMLVAGGPALLSPLDWGRYFLFPALFATFFIALGSAKGLAFLADKLPARKPGSGDPAPTMPG